MSGWDKPILGRDAARPTPAPSNPAPATPATSPAVGASDALPTQEMFVARVATRRMDELILPAETTQELLTLIDRLEHQHTLYELWGLKALDASGGRTVLNLYGPPGTGKTLAAEAIAHYLGKPLLDVNYAELESKYVGETGKNIVRAFEAAREQGAVLFFDEADSVLGKRLVEVRQSADHGVNQSRSVMLKQLEAFDGVVIFATNMAKNYDGAFVRRILGHVRFALPGEPERRRLWARYLLPTLPREADVTVEALAALGEGLSGGELLNALIGAASQAVRRPAESKRLSLDDLRRHIERVARARAEIGDYDYGDRAPALPVTVEERIISVEELPPKVRSDLEAHRERVDGAG
jgi:SpoVK/Ycf46/Vps4 family AAA+-type ATPase